MFVKTQPLECVGCGNCIAWWAFLLSPCRTKCLTLPRRPHHNFAVPNHPRSTAQVVQQVLLQVWRVWAVSPWGLKNLCTEKTDGRCFLETLRFFLPKKNRFLHFFGWKNVKTFTKKKKRSFFLGTSSRRFWFFVDIQCLPWIHDGSFVSQVHLNAIAEIAWQLLPHHQVAIPASHPMESRLNGVLKITY